jgi:hypothetical protein
MRGPLALPERILVVLLFPIRPLFFPCQAEEEHYVRHAPFLLLHNLASSCIEVEQVLQLRHRPQVYLFLTLFEREEMIDTNPFCIKVDSLFCIK